MPRDKNIFTLNPTSIDMRRSVFPRNHQHKTSFNIGQLVPIMFDEILPGDTVSLDFSTVIRMMTPIAPIMDNIYADVYFFFVPNRIIWSNWEQFMGANETGAWTNTAVHNIPVQDIGSSGRMISRGNLGDYFGLPVRPADKRDTSLALPTHLYVSELPIRAYFSIWNNWFRDENSISPKIFTLGDTANGGLIYDQALCKVSRFHDLFSSCLPAPQKGASVVVPLGTEAPLLTKLGGTGFSGHAVFGKNFAQVDGTTQITPDKAGRFTVDYVQADGTVADGSSDTSARVDLVADLSNATAATINQLRMAFQVQKLLERDARGGTRYREIIYSHFGTTVADSRMQIPEYLAGHRFRINVDQVVATADSGQSGSSAVGDTGAVSKTAVATSMFTKSFTEHGLLMGFVVVRQDHTYSDNLEKYWLKKDRFDFYFPVLANIGEVPVYKSELFAYGSAVGEGSGVFGYQEAWYEYRYKSSRCSGYMNPSTANSLNYWTLGDVYSAAPGLNATFLEESPTFLDRALTVGSSTMHNFVADFYFKSKYSRVMPVYSIPGLIDHH